MTTRPVTATVTIEEFCYSERDGKRVNADGLNTLLCFTGFDPRLQRGAAEVHTSDGVLVGRVNVEVIGEEHRYIRCRVVGDLFQARKGDLIVQYEVRS